MNPIPSPFPFPSPFPRLLLGPPWALPWQLLEAGVRLPEVKDLPIVPAAEVLEDLPLPLLGCLPQKLLVPERPEELLLQRELFVLLHQLRCWGWVGARAVGCHRGGDSGGIRCSW